jgi:isopentenyl diphosphate isomerase/L-lactate dehydrogenase-like FMN-dependent dehydrogenase
MFLCGARTLSELRRLPPIVRGATAEWLAQLGLEYVTEAQT